MAALIAIFLILFGTLVLYIRKQYNYWKDLGIPGPDPKFPYGTIVRSGNPVLNFKKHYETFKGKTPFCGLVNFITPTMLVTDPVLVKNILIRDFQYFNSRGIYYNEKDDPLSAHLFSVDGPKWKDLRTKLTPTFTSGKMKFMFNTIVAVSDQFKNVLADKVAIEKNTIEMKDLLARFTTDVIGTCAFGLECNSLVDPNAKFREMGLKFFNEPRHSLFGRVAITMMPGLSKFFHFKLIADDVSEFFMGAVQQTLEYRIKNNIQRNDFMDLLIKMYDETKTDDSNRGGLSFNEIAAQAWVFFLAGFETSSTAMSYALYELAQNQSIQEKARQDVLNALKKHENNFTYEAMQDMTYLEQFLIATFYTFVKIRYNYWKNLNIPGPEPKFPMGTFDRRASPVMNMVKYYNKFKGNGPFCGLINFFAPAIVVTDPALIKSILIKDFQYFHTRGIYYNEKDDPLSAHLFSIDGQKWKTLRTKLAPSFTSVKMKYMFSTVLGVSEIFKNVILHKVENNLRTIEMKDVFARFTTDVIGTCAFGVECNSLVDPDAKFREKGLKFFDKPRHARFGRLFMTYAPQIAKLLRFKVMSDDVAEFFMSAVEETVNHRMMNNIQRNDFMDLLIKMYDKNKIDNDLSKGLTLNEIAAQAWVFFLAGFETSSTAMSYTLYELAQNQELQEKARKNILTALKAFDGQITYESLQDMTFLEQCINEGMRKYPPVPTLIRRASLWHLTGTNLFDEPSSKLYRVYSGIALLFYFITIFHTFYCAFTTPEINGITFLLGTNGVSSIVFFSSAVMMALMKNDLKGIIKWVIKRHERRPNTLVDKLAVPRYEGMIKRVFVGVKIYGVWLLGTIIGTVTFPLISDTVDFVYPMTIPGLPSKGFPFFQINYIDHALYFAAANLFIGAYMASLVVTIIHVTIELDITLQICEKVGINESLEVKSNHHLDIETQTDFLLKTIVELHSDLTSPDKSKVRVTPAINIHESFSLVFRDLLMLIE
uniref:CSON011992 protein n=1 Tax=Culicoides sonorensis TaxID=179676 RepID=A0A336M9V7_CULSO